MKIKKKKKENQQNERKKKKQQNERDMQSSLTQSIVNTGSRLSTIKEDIAVKNKI